MKMKILMAIFCCLPGFAKAQTGQINYKILKIGETVPDIEIRNILNDKEITSKMSAYKDKLLILDFWGIYCLSCIEAFPKMKSLQEQFGDKIKILAVNNYDKEAAVRLFFKNNKFAKTNIVPTVVRDTAAFNQLFRHHANPFEVWIYKGVLIARTEAAYVDAKNIQSVLDGKKPDWPMVNDYIHIDPKQQLVTAGNTMESYVGLAFGKKENREQGVSTSLDSSTNIRRNLIINRSVEEAYGHVWRKLGKDGSVLFKVINPSKYKYNEKYGYAAEWERKNDINYESIYPDRGQADSTIYRTMLADLDRLLGLESHWEKRKEKIWVLYRLSKAEKIQKASVLTYDDLADDSKITEKGDSTYFTHYPLHNMIDKIMVGKTDRQIAWQDDYPTESGRINIGFKTSELKDFASIKRALNHYELDLKEDEKEFEYLVISEVGYKKDVSSK